MKICPDCHGKKEITAAHVSYADGRHGYNVPFPCLRCKGTGEVDDRMPAWILAGAILNQRRMNPYRTLREEAKRRGMDVVTLSRMEMGYIQPIMPEETS